MFLIRYWDIPTGSFKVERLTPMPTDVSYPSKRIINVRTPRDGSVVVQRPVRDNRPRRWVWRGYRDNIGNFKTMWAFLESMETKTRQEAGHTDLTVQIWESVSTKGGFNKTTNGAAADLVSYTNLKWTKVRLVQVDRDIEEGGGPVTYKESYIEFYIEDSTYTGF
jgi:hypothetical protein